MAYDPRSLGARCDECPLQGSRVVPPDSRPATALLLAIAEAPGRTEEECELPLVGASGHELSHALVAAGHSRDELSVTNAINCRPEKNDLRGLLRRINRENRARKAKKAPLIPSPVDCCRPRLLLELREHVNANVLLLGATPRAVLYGARHGNEKRLMSSRGYPDTVTLDLDEGTVREFRVLSTVHPAHVLRQRRWTWPFRADVAKAFRMATGTLRYVPPRVHLHPTLDAIEAFLARIAATEFIAYDTETDGIEPTTAQLRCIGIGSSDEVMVIPWRSITGAPEWSPAEYRRLSELICTWFADPSRWVVAQNQQYDLLVMEHNIPGFHLLRRVLDTVIAHHILWSELPHDLDFLSSQFSDAPAHKNVNHEHWGSDEELHHYCAIDVAQTANAAQCMVANKNLHSQRQAFQTDMFLSELCARMHETGIELDMEEMRKHAARLEARAQELQRRIQQLAVQALPPDASAGAQRLAEEFNPSSSAQLRQLLFDLYGISPVPENAGGLTSTGELAVGREQLFYLIDRGLPAQIEEILQTIIDYRTALKEHSTYCKLKPMPDGRIRPSWNPHVVVTGRLSANRPNVMNVRSSLRSIYSCAPGHALIVCDKAQLELRLISMLANDEELIEAFLSGADVHKVNACSIFGLSDITRITKALRQFAKAFTYAVQYGAGIQRAWRMVKNYRDKDGDRPYTAYKLAEAEANFKGWWRARYKVKEYHENNRKFFLKHGYIADALDGRWRLFLDGSQDNSQKEAMANFPIQATAAADMNAATRRVVEAYPWGFAGRSTGVIHQNHDSLMLEVPAGEAKRIGKHVQALMHSTLDRMPLPVDLAIGPNWGQLQEIED